MIGDLTAIPSWLLFLFLRIGWLQLYTKVLNVLLVVGFSVLIGCKKKMKGILAAMALIVGVHEGLIDPPLVLQSFPYIYATFQGTPWWYSTTVLKMELVYLGLIIGIGYYRITKPKWFLPILFQVFAWEYIGLFDTLPADPTLAHPFNIIAVLLELAWTLNVCICLYMAVERRVPR